MLRPDPAQLMGRRNPHRHRFEGRKWVFGGESLCCALPEGFGHVVSQGFATSPEGSPVISCYYVAGCEATDPRIARVLCADEL